MIVRTAIIEGTVVEADQPGFDRHMRKVVVPAIGRYPDIRAVNWRRSLAGGLPPDPRRTLDL
jgi:hypothetical protein